ncbi:MAG: bifunctional oligoribonuclease/PAP phosphatase NrnA [Acholeplasmatales bacterium]|jgi:phosphoesterase RecJ-like protein|nr:bifunctional oligoribonuclease/PAP phosphatase NrnA [Acholeplasmatales bacterium]
MLSKKSIKACKIIKKIIKQYDKIVLIGHTRPDGDCYGSEFGLYHLIKDNYPSKEVHISGEVCEYVSFLGTPEIVSDEFLKEALVIAVDCGNVDRLADKRISSALYSVKIDHHDDSDEYADMNWIVPAFSSCCEMIAWLAFVNRLNVDKSAGTAIYTGITTDTGDFKHFGVTSDTFLICSYLADCGVDVEEIASYTGARTLDTIKYTGYIYENCKYTKNGVVYIKITKDIVEKYSLSYEKAAAGLNSIGYIEGYPVWFMAIEYPSEIRLRLRSKYEGINEFARNYKGGGHSKAAGASLDSWDDLDRLLSDIDNFAKESKQKHEFSDLKNAVEIKEEFKES